MPGYAVKVGCLLVFAATLTSGAPPGTVGVPTDTGVVRPNTGDVVLPFDAYKLNDGDLITLDRATTALVRDCLKANGFAGSLPPAPDLTPVSSQPSNARRYGVVDPEGAARWGYHRPATGDDELAEEDLLWIEQLPDAARTAAQGADGEGGCTAQAKATLRAGVPVSDIPLAELDFQSLDRSAADERVGAARQSWRACMRERGFDYTDPDAAIEDDRWNLDSETVPPQEIAVAVADVACKQQVRLVDVWYDVEVDLQTEIVAQDATRFAALLAAKKRYLDNARQVLAEHNQPD